MAKGFLSLFCSCQRSQLIVGSTARSCRFSLVRRLRVFTRATATVSTLKRFEDLATSGLAEMPLLLFVVESVSQLLARREGAGVAVFVATGMTWVVCVTITV